MTHLYGALALIGLWGWLGSTAGFICAAFPARGRFSPKGALPWGVAVVVCFALWFLGMSYA